MNTIDLVHSLQQQLRLVLTYTRKSDAIRCQSALHELVLDSKYLVEEQLDLFTQLSSSVETFFKAASSEPLADADEAEADFYSAFQPALQLGFDRQDVRKCANTYAVVSACFGADITLHETMHLLMVLQWYREQQGSQSTLAASVVASIGPQYVHVGRTAPSVTAKWHAESRAAARSERADSKRSTVAQSIAESVVLSGNIASQSGIQYASLSTQQPTMQQPFVSMQQQYIPTQQQVLPPQPQHTSANVPQQRLAPYPLPPPPQILQHTVPPQQSPYGTQNLYPMQTSPCSQQPYFTQPQNTPPIVYPSPSPSNMLQPGTMHPSEYQTKLNELANFTKLKGDLLRGAPTFNGKGDFDVFLSEFHEYLNAQPYMTEELRKNLLRSSCRDTAREYLGSLTGLSGASFDVLVFSLRQRFGQTSMQRKLKFDKLSQYQSESMYEFADRVQKTAIGTERTMEEVIHRFLRGLRDNKLADKLTIQDFHSIPEVLARADKILSLQRNERTERRDNTSTSTDKPSRAVEGKAEKSSSNGRNFQKPAFKSEKKPFQKPARNQNCQYDDEVVSDVSSVASDVDDGGALNMIEVFNLAEDDYSSAIEEVLAARAEQPKHKYNLRSQGGLSKPSNHPTSQQDQNNMRAALGIPTPSPAAKIPPSLAPQPSTQQPSLPATPMMPNPSPAPMTDVQATPTPTSSQPRITRTTTKSSFPSPGFSYLSGDKIPLGDYLSLLVGNNEFLQKVLVSTLRRRYFELTTVKSAQVANTEPSALNLTSNPRPPRRSPLTWLPVQLGSSTTVVGACADTGAEVSLISTAVLDQAGISYDFESLPDAYPVKGITQQPQHTKVIQFPVIFQHESTPLRVTINFCLINSPDYRFLLGLDVLRPLAFRMSTDALTLTNPKSGVVADFPFEASKLFSLEVDDDSVSVLTIAPSTSLPFHEGILITKGDCQSPESTITPDVAINTSPPAPLITKGDDYTPPLATSKSYYSFPMSSAVVNYVGTELTDIIQVERLMVDSGLHQSFLQWGLDTNVDTNVVDIVGESSISMDKGEIDTSAVLYYLDEDVPELSLKGTHLLLCINAQVAYSIMQRVYTLGYSVIAVLGSCVGVSDCHEDVVRYLVLVSKQPAKCIVKQKVVPKVYLHTCTKPAPVARIYFQYGTLTHAIVHPSHITLDLPAHVSSFTLDDIPAPASVANMVPLSGLPLHVHSSYFDADHLFTETLVTKFQFLQDHQQACTDSVPTISPIEPTSHHQPYELSDARFHMIDSEQPALPSLEEAIQYLTSLDIEVSDHTKTFIQRGASVLQRTMASNPSAMNPELPTQKQTLLWQVLFDFQDICAFSFADMPQPALTEPFVIDTGTAKPISSRYYKLPAALETHLRSELTLNTQLGLMRHSSSPWASPLFAVPKPPKPNKPAEFRTVADFRGLNAVTVPDRYPLPLISQVFEEIGHSKYFHANDLFSGFWQISCHPDSMCKTAVTTRWGLFEYTRTPQGVRNAPSHFMRTINRMLTEEGLHHNNCAFVDDLTSHDATFDDSLVALRSVLCALRKIRMYIAPTKIRWGYTQLHLLGHLISQNQIRCQPSKIAAIAALPPPSDVPQLRSFLGITGYYRAFIADFAKLATPLFSLLKKNVDFVWTPACQEAFLALKNALQKGPVLNVPSTQGHFILYTDWSQDAVSAILHQEVEGVEHVIEYSSKTCNRHERNYCPTEGELLAIIYGLAKYRSYLLGQVFTIVTDHAALQYLNTSKASAKLARWGLFLSEFNFTIKYRKGSAHCNADALSRLPALPDCKFDLKALTCEVHFDDYHVADGVEELCVPQSVYQPSWHLDEYVPTLLHVKQELLESSPCLICDTDPQGDLPQVICDACNGVFHQHCLGMRKVPVTYWYCLPCMQKYHQSPTYDITYDLDFQEYALGNRKPRLLTNAASFEQLLVDGYSFQRGTLTRFLHGRVYQYPSSGRQILLLEEVHVRHGHVGAGRLYDLLSSEYWWPHLRQDCANFVSHCLACQLQKATFHREIPLEHLPLPHGPRIEWHIDLAPDLPVPSGVQQLIVCQDQYTKYIVLGTVSRRTSDSLAQWFNSHIISIFGVPQVVRSDQGSEFKGSFHQLLLDAGVSHITIPTESPWSNGAAERLVRTIKDFMKRIAVLEGESSWPSLLPSIQLGYNVAAHATSNISPFELMFGGRARLIIEECSIPNLPIKPSPSDYLRFTKEFLTQLRTQATKNREVSQRRAVDTYGAASHTDGCLKRPAKELRVGQLVAIRRQPRTHLGVTSVGPFIVTEVTGTHISVRSLTSGRSRREHRVNVIPLNLEFETL